MKFIVIIPVYPVARTNDMIWFPEFQLLPKQQIEAIVRLINIYNQEKRKEITIVTASPYIFLACVKLGDLYIDPYNDKNIIKCTDGLKEIEYEDCLKIFPDYLDIDWNKYRGKGNELDN